MGSDWRTDIDRIVTTVALLNSNEFAFADANRRWRVDDAIRVARATRELDYIFEQPCHAYEECLQVRRSTELPMKLDEVVTSIDVAQHIVTDRSAEVVGLKISNLGGLSKACRVRDYLMDQRIPIVAQDTWGGNITTSVVSHFAASTPNDMLVSTTGLHNYNTCSTGHPSPKTKDGKLYVSDTPGLVVEPDYESLGEPIGVYGEA